MEDLKIGLDNISNEIEKLWTNTIQKGETFPESLQKDIEKEIEKAIKQYHETIAKTGE